MVGDALGPYCNVAAQFIRYILEDVYHKTLPQLLQIYFLGPLDMKQTSASAFTIHKRALAKGYDQQGDLMPYIDWNDIQELGV